MIIRRTFLQLLPILAGAGILKSFFKQGEVSLALKEPPEDGDWDWWRMLHRTPLADSEDAMTNSLCQSAASREEVTILYDGGSQPGMDRRIAPLGVFKVDGYSGTYLHAVCRSRNAPRTFRIDRIRALV